MRLGAARASAAGVQQQQVCSTHGAARPWLHRWLLRQGWPHARANPAQRAAATPRRHRPIQSGRRHIALADPSTRTKLPSSRVCTGGPGAARNVGASLRLRRAQRRADRSMLPHQAPASHTAAPGWRGARGTRGQADSLAMRQQRASPPAAAQPLGAARGRAGSSSSRKAGYIPWRQGGQGEAGGGRRAAARVGGSTRGPLQQQHPQQSQRGRG